MRNQVNIHEATYANQSVAVANAFLKLSTVCHLMTLTGKWFHCEIILVFVTAYRL